MLRGRILWLLLNLTLVVSQQIVPYINTFDVDNTNSDGFLLEPSKNQYKLILRQFGAQREETVRQTASGELQLKGEQFHAFGRRHRLNITYEADHDGYRAKYHYWTEGVDRLSTASLKSSVGK